MSDTPLTRVRLSLPRPSALVWLGLALLTACALFLGWNLRGPVAFILELRAVRLAALLLVGGAAGAATVLFQSVAGNRLVSPGIVGFDSLFIFLQTMLVFGLGGLGYAALPGLPKFAIETVCLAAAASALFGLVLRQGAQDLVRMILTGVVLGVMFRGLAGFAQRLLDPSEFAIVQQASFASFGSVDRVQLAIASGVVLAALAGALALARPLDVVLLGRDKARSLGVAVDRLVFVTLVLVSVLVAASTALVGPVTFLGLLAASLARALVADYRHALQIPAAAMIGALVLVAGQFVFERLLGMQSTLAVIVEFLGGLLFLALVLKGPRR